MLSKLILFVSNKLGISALLSEIILTLIVGGGAYVLLKRHDAAIAEEWQVIGVKSGMEQMRVLKEKEWAERDANIAKEKSVNNAIIAEIAAAKADIQKLRDEATAAYTRIKETAQVRIVELPAKVQEIPPDKLIDTMRVQSAVLDNKLPESVIPTGVLVEPEERKMVEQFMELGIRRVQVIQYEDTIKIDKENDKLATANCVKEIEAQKTNTTICQKELSTALDKAQFFENAYKIVTKKRSKLCTLWKWLSFGMYKCH